MTAGRVLHTGQAIVDMVMRVAAMPPVGGDVYARSSELTAGGGFNVMAAAARDGAEVVYLGAHGDGPFGRIVRDALAAEGIASPAEPTRGEDTGYCVAIVDDTAERTFVSCLGAEGHVTLDHLRATPVRSDDVVYVTGYSLLHEINRASLLAWLPALPTGVRILFDPSPLLQEIPRAALEAMRERSWLWTLNARECAIALGILADERPAASGEEAVHGETVGPAGGLDPAEAATRLAAVVRGGVLVRAGAHGAYLVRPERSSAGAADRAVERVPGRPVTAVDTNGAGDAHTGVLAAHVARGGDLAEAVLRGNVAAAVAVTRPGPATSPTAAEIDALMS